MVLAEIGHSRIQNRPLVTRNLLAAAGSQTHVRIVPLSPSAQPQGGLSLPPSWGRFFVHSRGQIGPLRMRQICTEGSRERGRPLRRGPIQLSSSGRVSPPAEAGGVGGNVFVVSA